MLLKTAIISASREKVIDKVISFHSGDEREGRRASYNSVLDELIGLDTPKEEEKNCITVDVYDSPDKFDVYYEKENDDDKYSLDFAPWNEVVGFNIKNELIVEKGLTNIIAMILWELTYHGYSMSDIKIREKELFKSMEELEEDGLFRFVLSNDLE